MSSDSNASGHKPLSPAQRQRLQQCFQHATKAAAAANFDYAIELLSRCVTGDPGNLVYAQNLLGTMYKKFNNNKKGSKLASLRGAGGKAAVKKSQMQKDWAGVIRAGIELLKLNPWDASTLTAMADACERLDHDDAQLAYLRAALNANIKDAEINRLAGKALARQGKFEDAIVCWTRVCEALPNDEEAKRAVADLTVERTIHKGGYEQAESTTELRADDDEAAPTGPQATPERQLEKAIAKSPDDVGLYLKLVDLHEAKERWDEAEAVLNKALEASGGALGVRERLEDLELRRLREQTVVAQRRAQNEKTPEAIELYRRFAAEQNQREMEVYLARTERHPSHAGYKIELAHRMKRSGKYREAIPVYQQAQADPRRRGEVLLALGECFQRIEQYRLAMQNYEGAVAAIPPQEIEPRKQALYLAARLAYGLKNPDTAERYASELAGLDFGYKDIAALLDKIAELRKKVDSAGG